LDYENRMDFIQLSFDFGNDNRMIPRPIVKFFSNDNLNVTQFSYKENCDIKIFLLKYRKNRIKVLEELV